MELFGVIMAGGSGTRFWPYSRKNRPKQLLKIFSDVPMIQETVERLAPLIPQEKIYISTNQHLAQLMQEQLKDVQYVIEPVARNTAACIGLSAITIMEENPDAIMFIETADHVYKDESAYLDTVRKAVIAARKDKIVLIGIEPTNPHTDLGYIKAGEAFSDDVPSTHLIESFKEKPDLKTAKKFLEERGYFWNSGMFISKCSVMLEEIRLYLPQLYEGLQQIRQSGFDSEITKEVFEQFENTSIDYGVMEKSRNTVVVTTDMAWDDVGDFSALERSLPKDDRNNVSIGNYEGNAKGCILLSQTRKIVVNHVHDIVVADTPDVTLICTKQDIQKIKRAIEKVQEADLGAYFEDYVKKPSKNIISHHADTCEVETDGLMVLIGVENLEIHRNNTTLNIEGSEDVDI